MGFFKKLFRPVAKVFDKIIPNEIKPALPYLAAFAPMLAPTTGFMGSMMGRALLSGGANIGAQLAQEGNEGDINALSALMASGIGALSAPGSTGGRTLPDGSGGSYSQVMGGDKLASVGNQSAGNYLRDLSNSGGIGDKALNFLGQGADKLSAINIEGGANPFSKAGLKAAALPIAQGTGDVMYAEGTRALKDYEIALRDYENSLTEGQFASDSGRRTAIINAMTGNHTQEVIDQTLTELGLRDGGRVNAMGGGIMSNQRINFAGGGMDFGEEYIMIEGEDGPIRIKKSDYESMPGMFMDTTTSLYGDAGRGRPVPDFSEENNEPDFGGIKEAIKNINEEKNKEAMEELNSGETVSFNDLAIEKEPDTVLVMIEGPDGVEIKQVLKSEALKENLKIVSDTGEFNSYGFKNGGIMNGYNMGGSVLPQGMEMDYRGGGFIPMGSKERADDVPARVSKNEFVMTADAVRAAGGGSINQGAKKMYEIMNNLEARA